MRLQTQEAESVSLCDDSFGDFTEAAASESDGENELEQEVKSGQQTDTGEPRSGCTHSVVAEENLHQGHIPGGLDAEVLASSLDRLSLVDLLKEIESSSSSVDPVEQKSSGNVLKRHAFLETTRHPWKGSLFETEMMGRLGLQRVAEAQYSDDLDILGEIITD